MKVGICDDNVQSRLVVSNWLKTRPDVLDRNVYEFSCGAALLEHLRRFTLDIVFLDCRMEGMDGIETATAIRKNNDRLVIILLTDFQGYAMFGYRADILDYILKKDFGSQISDVFDRAVKRIKDNTVKTYSVKAGNGLIHLDISEILYIESHLRKKMLATRDGQSYEFYGRIEDIEQALRKYGFIRPHNSYLVNSRYVKVIMPHSLWLSGHDLPLPVSKGKYKQAYDDLTVFANEVRL